LAILLRKFKTIEKKGFIKLPNIPSFATNNAHMFFLICKNGEIRNNLLSGLKQSGVLAVFHYLPLHESKYYNKLHDGRVLKNVINFSETLIRLPLYFELKTDEQQFIIDILTNYFKN